MLIDTKTNTALASAIDASQTSIALNANASVISTYLTTAGSYGYLQISDGVNSETVKITSIAGSVAQVVRGLPAFSFIKGSCVKTDTGFATVCALIEQGGCSGASQSCVPVTAGAYSLPDAVVGKPYVGLAMYPNATSIVIPVKPVWMNAVVTGQSVAFSGIAPVGAADFSIGITATGCNSSSVAFVASIRVCEQVAAV